MRPLSAPDRWLETSVLILKNRFVCCSSARFGTPVSNPNQRENTMNYALLEYLAAHENRPHWSAGAGAPLHTETRPHERLALADRILRWWLRRSTWRLVRLRV